MEPGGGGWRRHPLVRRLPVLALLALGLWWWRDVRAPERELVWRLEGPGWSEVRTLDVQVKDAGGELVKRSVFTFPSGPPATVSLKAELARGTYEVWVFSRAERGPSPPPWVESLVLGDEESRVERGVRRSGSR